MRVRSGREDKQRVFSLTRRLGQGQSWGHGQGGSQGLGEGPGGTLVKGDRFPIKRRTFWGLTYSAATTANNAVLCV